MPNDANRKRMTLPKSLHSPAGARILLVAGDAHQLLVASSLLRELGVEVKRNTTGVSVAAQAAAMSPRPDLILLDLDLPEADPLAICAHLKRHRRLASIPVIAFGGAHWWTLQTRLEAAEFSGFIAKPLPRKLLRDLLQRALDGLTVWHAPASAASTAGR